MIHLLKLIDQVHKHLKADGEKFYFTPYCINDLKRAIFLISTADNITFRAVVPTEADAMQFPIFGRMKRFQSQPSPYADFEETVVIEFHDGLPPEWKYFSIAKELCAILCSEAEATRTQGSEASLALVRELNDRKGILPFESKQMAAEDHAVWLAAEMLCPFEFRENLVPKIQNGEIKLFEVRNRFGIPEAYAQSLFDPTVHGIMSTIRK